MQRSLNLAHGAVGGLIAGAVVALWFLVVDVVHGSAFMTPMVLGSAVFGGDFSYPSWGMVAAYSVLHFAAFAALGMAATWLLWVAHLEPRLLSGFLFGLIALSTFHYTGLLLGGVISRIVLPPLHVLGANSVAGMALMWYLHRAQHSTILIGPAAVLQYPLVRRGLAVGLVGAAAVAAWFLVLDVTTGRPFFTPAALGSVAFFGTSDPWDVRMGVGLILAYTVVHVAAFGLVGMAFAWMAQSIVRTPSRWLMVFMAFVVLDGMFVGTVGSVASWVLDRLGLWAIVVGNLLAVASMSWAVWFVTPELGRRLQQGLVETAV